MADPWSAFPDASQNTWTDADRAAVNPAAGDPWAAFPDAQKPQQFEQPKYTGFFDRMADTFTGAKRTEYPDAPEFLQALTGKPRNQAPDIGPGAGQEIDFPGLMRSAITSNPEAALDIIKKTLPGVESRRDKFGNLMLRVPGIDWAYLNKPGLSARDIDELGTQTLATLPFMGAAGAGATLPARIASGAGFMGAGELERQALERAAGSEQKADAGSLAAATIGGGVLAPGVPSSLVRGVMDTGRAVVAPVANVIRGTTRADEEAARRVATAFEQGSQPTLGPGVTFGGRPLVGTPEELQHRGANLLQERAGPSGTPYGEETRLMDIGGEPTRALARWAANVSPEARQTLEGVTVPRFETQGQRVSQFLQNINEGPTANQSRETLQELARTARAPFYENAFREGAEGYLGRDIQNLMAAPAMQDAMQVANREIQNSRAAGRLRTDNQGPEGPTLEYWDQVKRALNDQFNRLAGQGRNSAAANVAAITDRLITILDRQFPTYTNARGVAHGFFRANDALQAGENFASGRFDNYAARQHVETLNPMERDLFRQGYTDAVLRQISERGDRRNIMNSLQHSVADRERLDIALGPQLAEEFRAALQSERLIDLARGAISGNSTTARQLMEIMGGASAGAIISGFDPSNPAAWLAGYIVRGGLKSAGARVDMNIANRVAQMLVSRDPTIYRRGLQLTAQNRPIMDALYRADVELDRVARNTAIKNVTAPSQDQGQPEAPRNAMPPPVRDGATATGPNGEKAIRRNGRWVDEMGRPL